jgi:hypothetical protein
VGKLRPRNAHTWQTIVLEPSNWMTEVRLRKFKLSFLIELFLHVWSVLAERNLVLGPKSSKYFGTNKGQLLQKEIRHVQNLCFPTISLPLTIISLFLLLEKFHGTCCIAKAKQQKTYSGHSLETHPTELYRICNINFTLSIVGAIVIAVWFLQTKNERILIIRKHRLTSK